MIYFTILFYSYLASKSCCNIQSGYRTLVPSKSGYSTVSTVWNKFVKRFNMFQIGDIIYVKKVCRILK